MRNRLRVAISDGNWSNPAIWNDNSVPEERDVVALNGQHVVLDQDVTVYGLFNNIQTPINSFTYLTFNDEPEGIAEDSGGGANAWYPFGNVDTYYNIPGVTAQNPYWVSYEYPNQDLVLLKKYQFRGYDPNHPFTPSSWLFQGWNGTSWVTLDDKTNYGANYQTYVGDLSSNTTAYYKYRFYVMALQGGPGYTTIKLSFVRFWEDKSYQNNSIDGGDLTINTSRTLTVTGPPITGANYDLIYCTANTGSVVNLNLNIIPNTGDKTSITINGTGQYNITGNLLGDVNYYSRYGRQIKINQPCTLNVFGNVRSGGINSPDRGISVDANGSTINVIGNLYSGGGIGSYAIYMNAVANLNVTGDVYGAGAEFPNTVSYGGGGIISNNINANITIVGNVYGGGSTNYENDHYGIYIATGNNLTITGNIISNNSGYNNFGIRIATLNTLNVVGLLQANGQNPAIYRNNLNIADHYFTGPFISSTTGTSPFVLLNFKIIPTANNYFQLRDNTILANTYTLYSADTVIDSPNPEDVRQGTTYALGNYVGTLAVPSPGNVALNIPVDNTVGTAILTSADIWNIQTSALTVAGSVGVRLKNVATIGMVGAQFEAFLKKE